MDKALKILHLSDLHLDKDHLRDQRVVLRALFQDIGTTVSEQGPYDLVFFTGDLVAKGGYSDANKAEVVSEFIVPLLSAAQIEPSRLILIPGNHDVNLKGQSGLIASAQKSISCDDDAAAYLKDAIVPGLNNGLEGFNDILEKLDASDLVLGNTHYRAYLIDVDGLKVGVGAMNSAWHATGAPSDGDYGKLLVSRMQMDEVVEALNGADLKLALLHHPLSWLSPKDAQNTHRQILIHFDGFFHGHNHESDAVVSVGTSSTYFISNAGCLYQHRDYFNGYCSINYFHRNKRWVVRAREYYEARQVFDKAIRFNTDGAAEFIQTREVNAQLMPPSPSDEYIDSVQATFNSRLLPSLVSEVAPHSLKSIFVEPPLSRVSQRKIDGSGKNGKSGVFVPLKELLQSKKHIMFLGTKDMGKTTLLQHVCSLSLQFGSEMPPFGGYVDLELAGETVPSLVDAIISFCGGAYRKAEIIALLQAGEFSICFDNLDERRAKQLKAVREFCASYARCRYYFSMLEDLDYSLSTTEVPIVVEGAEIIYLHPFGRKQTRLLTHNWFGESVEECGAKVDEVLSLLGRLNIPRSPFLISALLWIRERQTQFTPVNQAEILDALIDGVMEKLSETKDRSKNDSTIKRHYLAALAEHLYGTGKKKIPTLELESFTVEYFASKGLPASTGPFLAELKAKRILLEVGNEVTFMFEAIRAFFLSTRLHENPALLAKALSREHFLELAEELDYYTGRHRDRPEVLKKALELVAEVCSETNIRHELSEFDKIRIGDAPVGAPIAGRISPVPPVRPSVAQRHKILDSYDERSAGKPTSSAEVVRATKGQSGIARYLEALKVGSAILRNSELVGDLALKEEGYDKLAGGWCQVLIEVVHAIDSESSTGGSGDSSDDPVLHLLQGLLPTDNPGMAKHLKKLVIPNVIMSFALEAIGTSKLQIVMEKHLGHSHTTVQRVLDVFLIVDLRFPKWLTHLESLLKTYPKNRFVCELVFSKLFQIYMLGRLHVNEEERIRSLLGETIALMTPGSKGNEKTQRKGNFLRDLEKRKLIRYKD